MNALQKKYSQPFKNTTKALTMLQQTNRDNVTKRESKNNITKRINLDLTS